MNEAGRRKEGRRTGAAQPVPLETKISLSLIEEFPAARALIVTQPKAGTAKRPLAHRDSHKPAATVCDDATLILLQNTKLHKSCVLNVER